MYSLNYICFAILAILYLRYLMSPGKVVTSPFDHRQEILFDGPEMCWVLVFATGVLALSSEGVIDLMAMRMMLIEAICITGLFVTHRSPVWTVPLYIYVLYLFWIIIGCSYSPDVTYGVRIVLKYLFPLFLTLFASSAVRHPEVFIKASLGAVLMGLASYFVWVVPGLNELIHGFFWYATARAINYISLMVFCLTLFFYTDEKKKYLLLAILFIIPCFAWVFRTSIMGSIVALAAFSFIKYRVRSVPLIVGIVLLGIVAVFALPNLHKKMFKKGSGNITIEQFQSGKVSMKQVETNAREAMWTYLEARFYKPHKLEGSGTGAVQQHMYSHYLFGGLRVPHSDFVQIRCDNGLVGLSLYGLAFLCIFIHCFRVFHREESIPIKMCALTAGASLAGVFVTLYSENTVNYSLASLSMPFGFYGMMLGLLRGKEDTES